MGSDEEKKEVVVKAPSKSTVSAEKKVEKATVKALEEERFNVIQVSQKIGKYFGILSISMGTILLVLLAYVTLAVEGSIMALASMSIPIFGLWIAAGLVSVLIGFLLIGSE